MLKLHVIGHLGADVEIKDVNGSKFASFRVAHTDKRIVAGGETKEVTTWVECTLPEDSKVIPYLKRGTLVFCEGQPSFRAFSSEKYRCYMVGVSLRVSDVQLLSAKKDDAGEQQNNGNNEYNGF